MIRHDLTIAVEAKARNRQMENECEDDMTAFHIPHEDREWQEPGRLKVEAGVPSKGPRKRPFGFFKMWMNSDARKLHDNLLELPRPFRIAARLGRL